MIDDDWWWWWYDDDDDDDDDDDTMMMMMMMIDDDESTRKWFLWSAGITLFAQILNDWIHAQIRAHGLFSF